MVIFILIPHYYIEDLGISLLIIYTFFSKEVETVFLLSELAGYESGFLVNLLINAIWVNDHFLPSFSVSSSIPYSCFIHPFLKFSVKSLIVK